ncbi:hypothetical protein AB0Y53_21835 [Parabacteroides distasonis]|uniref:hypothetical protein n=1 Tax=Parabacteroides distasonis TaxID=823 RepID=UPI003F27DD38
MNELEAVKEWNNKIEEQQEVLNKVIVTFYKEIDLKVKMVNRGLLGQLSAFNELKGMLSGIEITAKVIAPDNVLPITTNNFLEYLFLGDKEQQAYAKEYLTGFLKSVK